MNKHNTDQKLYRVDVIGQIGVFSGISDMDLLDVADSQEFYASDDENIALKANTLTGDFVNRDYQIVLINDDSETIVFNWSYKSNADRFEELMLDRFNDEWE